MRTQQEIVDHIRGTDGFLGFSEEVLVPYLDFDHAKPFLKEGVTPEDWKQAEPSDENVLAAMRSYMEFAWGKVIGHRGISAGRSVVKMRAWLWLLGNEDLLAWSQDDDNYPYYGAPILMRICEEYGFMIPQDEAVQNMARGMECQRGCDEGCGR